MKEMAEDCLYLSIWSPGGKGKSVLVWLSGGGEEVEGGGELAARGDIIVVRVESRRGALGFLALGDQIPGNAGLLDQVMALQWVRDNIDRFGGLSDRVTIMGARDAADLASLHLVSPLSCPLFHAAILMSGATPPPLPSPGQRRGPPPRHLRPLRNFSSQDSMLPPLSQVAGCKNIYDGFRFQT